PSSGTPSSARSATRVSVGSSSTSSARRRVVRGVRRALRPTAGYRAVRSSLQPLATAPPTPPGTLHPPHPPHPSSRGIPLRPGRSAPALRSALRRLLLEGGLESLEYRDDVGRLCLERAAVVGVHHLDRALRGEALGYRLDLLEGATEGGVRGADAVARELVL